MRVVEMIMDLFVMPGSAHNYINPINGTGLYRTRCGTIVYLEHIGLWYYKDIDTGVHYTSWRNGYLIDGPNRPHNLDITRKLA
ncbi:MAG: hypothetical protein AAFU41_00910 [Pseudomonadota bacterium]